MKTIKIYGSLGEKYGKEFRLSVRTPAEVFRALSIQLPGFGNAVRDGFFEIIRGPERVTGVYDTEETLTLGLGTCDTLHIVPVVVGSGGGGGIGKAIIGAVIMVAAVVASPFTSGASFGVAMASAALFEGTMFAVSYGAIFMFGMAMTLMGVASMLMPTAKVGSYSQRERPDAQASFFLGGQVNRMEQGGSVPLVYGRMRVGSTVIAAGLSAEAY